MFTFMSLPLPYLRRINLRLSTPVHSCHTCNQRQDQKEALPEGSKQVTKEELVADLLSLERAILRQV